jgi:SNF2 family DNA or RNA helicase
VSSPITLRQYQIDAANWLVEQPRALLCDSPGLGKTYPAIVAALCNKADDPVLIVAPAYLLNQWKTAIETYTGLDLDVLILERKSPPIPGTFDGLVICSYHTLMHAGVAKHPELLYRRWGVVILDECHRMRGRTSQWTKNIWHLKARHIYGLTGTPIVNNGGDIWPLLKLMDSKTFRGYWPFVREWCQTFDTPFGAEIGGIKPGLEPKFHDMLDKWMLRRRIEDHLPELPPVIHHAITVDLPRPVQKMHDRAKKEWFIEHEDLSDPIAITSGGALVAKLRQITGGVLQDAEGFRLISDEQAIKVNTVVELLSDHPNEPAIVFCWFRETANLLSTKLIKKDPDRPVTVCTGVDLPSVRAGDVERWKLQSNGVIVATISALQEGANLQHARMIVFAESDYLPASVEQCIARVRRFGQEYPVNSFEVYCRNTVDQVVMRARNQRSTNIRRALLEDLRDLPTAA